MERRLQPFCSMIHDIELPKGRLACCTVAELGSPVRHEGASFNFGHMFGGEALTTPSTRMGDPL